MATHVSRLSAAAVDSAHAPLLAKTAHLILDNCNRFWSFCFPSSRYGNSSYSQSGEDLIARYIFTCIGVAKPTYLDIGAHHPFYLNNTAHFYCSGSIGINVEPNPLLFRAFPARRPRDVNLNVGVLENSGTLPFYVLCPDTMSTFSKANAESLIAKHGFALREVREVPVTPIGDILAARQSIAFPDFLTVDVEGFELDILKTIDFSSWSPLVICCETATFCDTGLAQKNTAVIDFLRSRGYMVYADTNINTIFVLFDRWQRR